MNNINTKEIQRLLLSHNFFIFARILFNLFITLFIWDQTESIVLVAQYSIIALVVHTVCFTGFGYVVKQGHLRKVQTVGLLGFMGSMLLVAFLQEQAIHYILLIAALKSIFTGMYWISYHVLRFDYTNSKNRGNYSGVERSLQNAIKIVAPLLGGYIISVSLFGFGYASVFFLAAISLGLAVVTGLKHEPEVETKSLHLKETWQEIKKHKDILYIFASGLFAAIGRRGAIDKLLPILIFDLLQNEFEVGGIISIFAVIAVITTFLAGKHVHYKHLNNVITVSSGLLFIAFLSLIGFPNIITYIIFGIFSEILGPKIHIGSRVYQENLLHTIENYKKHRVEYMLIREIILIGFGRTSGYVLLLFVSGIATDGFRVVLAIMAVTILLEAFFIRKIKTDLTTI